MPAPELIVQLVQKFQENREAYRSGKYNEARLRQEFLDKFFIALGWDVYNEHGAAPDYAEVAIEDSLEIDDTSRAPDYAFKIGRERKFFVEAKKPKVDIQYDIHPAYQLRRYAWNAHMPLSILTDFEEFAVYNCKPRPNPSDSAATGRDLFYRYTDYIEKWDEIAAIFSKDAVWKGGFDRFAAASKGKKGTTEVDDEFLKDMDEWRLLLARNIALRNPQVEDEAQLNYAVQMTIDRIIFLRICEDREIEPFEQLKGIAAKPGIYDRLVELFRRADVKYNSGLFHFSKEKGNGNPADTFTPQLKIDDKVLKEIITSIYYPCPYIFKEIPVEILGQVYEQFLGKVIRLTAGHQAKVEEKPEVRKAGGVYYTPKYIVDYIVANTVGELLKDKTPQGAAQLKIVDPACGSGSFLLGAYQYLLDWHLQWYMENDAEKWAKGKDPALVQAAARAGGSAHGYRLTTQKKKEILVNSIHGVDIDAQAVEVTKLSLLLKVLEEESGQMSLGFERALPDLGKNIQCGNSLIGEDYFEGRLAVDAEERRRVNPFDWKRAFPQVFSQGGFDAVIGNPPYLKEANNKALFEDLRRSGNKNYCIGKMDLWYVFACVGVDLLRLGGLHSFIATNNWGTNAGSALLRSKLMSETKIMQFVDFSDFRVFTDASIQTMIYVVKKQKCSEPYLVDYLKINDAHFNAGQINELLSQKGNPLFGWILSTINPNNGNKAITFTSGQIDNILNKLEFRARGRLSDSEIGNGIDVLQDFISSNHLLKLKRDVHIGQGVFVLTNEELVQMSLTENEVKKIKPYYTSREIGRYHSNHLNSYWLVYADKEVRENINQFPGIKKHLDKFTPILTSAFAPYGLHRPRDERFFIGDKILSLRKTRSPEFSYIEFPCYVSRAFLVIKPTCFNESLKYMLGLLNSRLLEFWLYHRGKKQGDQLQIDKEPLTRLPIYTIDFTKKIERNRHDLVVNLVESMLELHKKTPATPHEQEQLTREIEATDRQIDRLVYDLYGLTEEEIKIVESS